MDSQIKSSRGQVTIFIIVGVVIVFTVVIALSLFNSPKENSLEDRADPSPIIRGCVSEVVERSIQEIILKGGVFEPAKTIPYENQNYTYLCYQEEEYQSCINHYPGLQKRIEGQIRTNTLQEVQTCFDEIRQNFEDLNFEVTGKPSSYSIELISGRVIINLEKEIVLSKQGSSSAFEKFDTSILSSTYELVELARRIINEESTYCTFDHVNYVFLYPEYDIQKTVVNADKIYTLKNRKTEEEFKFAVRTCPFSGGI